MLIEQLTKLGAQVVAFDPIAMVEAKKHIGDNAAITSNLSYAESAMQALEGADALAIATEWKTFRSPDFTAISSKMKQPIIFDGRNLYEPETMRAAGFEYYPIGREQVGKASAK